MRLLLFLILFFPVALIGGSRQMYSYNIQQGSRIAIAGSTNINQFACFSASESPGGVFMIETQTGCNTLLFSDAALNINVGSFDCGNRLMNRDMHQAMGSNEHPIISIRIIEGTPLEHNPKTGSGTAQLLLSITLNGITGQSHMLVEYQGLYGNQVSVIGSKKLRMSDFGITPPSPALGLVKVRDEVAIRMNLIISASLISQN